MTVTGSDVRGLVDRAHTIPTGRRAVPISVELPRTDGTVGLLDVRPFEAAAMQSWLGSIGHRARVIVAADLRASEVPSVVIARDPQAIDPRVARHLRNVRFIAVTDRPTDGTSSAVVVIVDSPTAPDEVQAVVDGVLGGRRRGARIRLSERELDVMTTYVMGATVSKTAAKHFIAEATVRTHYQRVTRRYEEAGRPVANKSQLLVRMVSDGWIELE
ncbi:hypothetical protein nbrc107696_11690 [Gordonia spumicola]|uniref:HTH luxR-type domain-containing protein n=1 Tax=Gordonia spumicola TaxID=589161 RepID=A0A7I9V6L0_9ACTN|nr:LuxR C-terminal-related transcriptional regulator [Gordonia spumicola]GEE00723.1 hypothetical protein nbrc107696_11690 [Gordonia spumicola]